MNDQAFKYSEYLNVDKTYFPCIDESAINAGVDWTATYPHETFVDLLEKMEKTLGGKTNLSLWIHGAYGTGKSQCAYALQRLLEVSPEEFEGYWERYDALKNQTVLKKKLLGHKEHGIVTAYRYSSSEISTARQLFFAIQESVKASLEKIPGSYKGENTLKESVVAWLEDPSHSEIINLLLKKPEWRALFPQPSADAIVKALQDGDEVVDLMENLAKLGSAEGINTLSLTSDSLCKWLDDVVSRNHTKLVLFWDEFSGFFRQPTCPLDAFQKIASLCQQTPFYFVIVTHPLTSITPVGKLTKDDPMSVVQQRFDKVEITLPPNIAFELTSHAFSVKPSARDGWKNIIVDLSGQTNKSQNAVMLETKVENKKIIQNMLPIQPMAALVLKNIASAFGSNQRSMFQFINTSKEIDGKAFQWFIQNTSPESDRKLLTIDMLWDFFYEKEKGQLSDSIRRVLDVFQQQAETLVEKEQIVLKTILIMQAVDQQLGGAIPLLKPTDQNLRYAFEGDSNEFEQNCINIAKALVDKGVLILTPISGGKPAFSAAVLAGDGETLEKKREEARRQGTIEKLTEEGTELSGVLALTPPLRLRFSHNVDKGSLSIVTINTFTQVMNTLKTKEANWKFYAVLALAKTAEEATKFRNLIQKTIANEDYRGLVVIDALDTPLELEKFDRYVENVALSAYYANSNKQQSAACANSAKEVLNKEWKDSIKDGNFTVWTFDRPEGETVFGATGVHALLHAIVLKRFPLVLDFTPGLTESQLKISHANSIAKQGMGSDKTSGVIKGCENTVLGAVWNRQEYWKESELANEPIVQMKVALDRMINDSFKKEGRVSIDDIYNFLEDEYGIAPSNLTAFILGFLLKEFQSDPYRYCDSQGAQGVMKNEKLSEMIGLYMGGKSKPVYIVSRTKEEKAFYELTELAWDLPQDVCASPTDASEQIRRKMREIVFPIWTLKEVDDAGVYDVVEEYLKMIQGNADAAHAIALEIGERALHSSKLGERLRRLITSENCQIGARLFLERFENGRLPALAQEIHGSDIMLNDVKERFRVKNAALWNKSSGEAQIKSLIVDYEFIKATNSLLNVSNNTKSASFDSWKETLKFVGFSCEALQSASPELEKLLRDLKKIAVDDLQGFFLPDVMKQFVKELKEQYETIKETLKDTVGVFSRLYAPYLEGFTPTEVEEIKASIKEDVFVTSTTKSNETVKKAAENYRKNQEKTQLFELWRQKADGTKSPRHWSEKHQTPILCCVEESRYDEAKKAFNVLNRDVQTSAEIASALAFLKSADFLEALADPKFRDQALTTRLVGEYQELLPDVQTIRSALENLSISAYDWLDDPQVAIKLKAMAEAAYHAGGSDDAMATIDSMKDDELRSWLKSLAAKDMTLGVRLMNRKGTK